MGARDTGRRQTLLDRAKSLEQENVFLGGPLKLFETAGRKQLIVLLSEGLSPGSKVLDIGCGCLRCGYWLIHFLDPARYFGIEPNRRMLDGGIRLLLEPGLLELKQPRFDGNADFDFSVFGEVFDFLVARSIWTHASKTQIKKMLDGFVNHSSEGAAFITSYLRTRASKRDYSGEDWVGRSHQSNTPGLVWHSLDWIQRACEDRGLVAEEIAEPAYNFGDQTWLRVKRKVGPVEDPRHRQSAPATTR